jgi:hypothetical protein
MAAIRNVPNVAYVRPELALLLPQYQLIRDCIAGETVIKAAAKTYLPMPAAHDVSAENVQRYKNYLARAVFYNVTRRTLLGMMGQVFKKAPDIKIPAQLEPMTGNVTGTGTSLNQLAEISLGHAIAYSRSGLFADFTNTGGVGASADDVQSGKVRPTLYAYSPLEIINWRVIEDNSVEKLALVVLMEGYPISDDGFEVKTSAQFRVLKLANGRYVQEIWRDPTASGSWDGVKIPKAGNFKLHETIEPTDANGNPITEIPFWFIGSQNNDINPDNPNMYDLASLNVAHYRNSADYEESCFIVGQPTPVATGLTEQWVKEVLGGSLAFGSRGGIPLPTGATAELLQAEPNSMIKEAMDTKERQMTALGAKLVEQKQVQRTATEAGQDQETQNSVLTSCANNVSVAYKQALEYCASLMGAAGQEIVYTLNTDFDFANLTPDQLNFVLNAWQKGALSWEEVRAYLRRAGVATADDDKAKQDIANDQIEAFALAAAHDPTIPTDNPPPASGG